MEMRNVKKMSITNIIAVPAGDKGNCPPSFQNLSKILNFRAVTQIIWEKPEFFGQ